MGGRSIELLLALALTNPEIVMATALLNLFVGVDLLLGAGDGVAPLGALV
jgi:ABC-type spermidine/putrescine transport system permease subunit II